MLGLERRHPAIIDLFCGCSGLGYGATRAGFRLAASVDCDPILTSSHETNLPGIPLVLADVAALSGSSLRNRIGERVDGVIGGPPCQGFSEIGRADPEDPRRHLLDHFFRLVAELSPRFFIMENVRGLLFEKNRAFLNRALDRVSSVYRILEPFQIDAGDYGAATRRPRVFVIGYDPAHVDPIELEDLAAMRVPPASVEDAIGDLRGALEIGFDECGFDYWQHSRSHTVSAYAHSLRRGLEIFTGNRRTPHKPSVAARFATVAPGKVDAVGRHPRLSWSGQCPTLRAGTGPERGSYQAVRPLHPGEDRVITVREAARLQGFPDVFRFHPTVWHSFRMIGNSVSPVLAEKVFRLLISKMRTEKSPAAAAE